MSSVVLIARLALAGVFATAGIGKLLDLRGTRHALGEFGVPKGALRVVGILLPLTELAVAVALLFPPSARWGALLGLALLLAFIAGIARALSRGRAPDCHCFGQIHSAPAGRGTLIRNAVLAVLAGLVVGGPGPSIVTWVADRSGAELVAVVAGAAAVGLGGLALRLWLDNRTLRKDLLAAQTEIAALPAGLPIGATAPGFSLPGLGGKKVTLEALCARGHPVLLVFAAPTCGPCWMLLPHLRRWQSNLAHRLTVAIVSTGTEQENLDVVDEHGIVEAFAHDGAEVMEAYRADATPSAVLVSPEGKIASTTVVGARPVEPLVRLTLLRGGHGAVGLSSTTPPRAVS